MHVKFCFIFLNKSWKKWPNKTVFIWSGLTYKHLKTFFCVVKFSSGYIATELRAHLWVNLPKFGQLHFLALFDINRHFFAVIVIFSTSLALICHICALICNIYPLFCLNLSDLCIKMSFFALILPLCTIFHQFFCSNFN